MLHFYNTWADHAHKIAHERKILKIFYSVSHIAIKLMFYTWHDHAHHRHLQRAKMKVVFNYMAKGYERKAWSIWTGRAAHYKKVYDLLLNWGNDGSIETSTRAFINGISRLYEQDKFNIS